jgi:hypothetical protein
MGEWEKIRNSDKFFALSPDEKREVATQYFDRKVKARDDYKGLDRAQQAEVEIAFFQTIDPEAQFVREQLEMGTPPEEIRAELGGVIETTSPLEVGAAITGGGLAPTLIRGGLKATAQALPRALSQGAVGGAAEIPIQGAAEQLPEGARIPAEIGLGVLSGFTVEPAILKAVGSIGRRAAMSKAGQRVTESARELASGAAEGRRIDEITAQTFEPTPRPVTQETPAPTQAPQPRTTSERDVVRTSQQIQSANVDDVAAATGMPPRDVSHVARKRSTMRTNEEALADFQARNNARIAQRDSIRLDDEATRAAQASDSVAPGQTQVTAYDMYRNGLRSYENAAEKVQGWVIAKTLDSNALGRGVKKFFDPIAYVPDKRNYRALKNLFYGNMAETERVSNEFLEEFGKLTPDRKKQVFDYMTGASPDNAGIEAATRAKQMISEAGQGLVERGQLEPEQYAMWKDRYLPRLYLRHLLQKNDLGGAGALSARKGYSLQRDANLPKSVREALGEIEDPGFLTANALLREQGDIHMHDFLESISRHPEWSAEGGAAMWPSFTSMRYPGRIRTYTQGYMAEELTHLRRIFQQKPESRAQLGPVIEEGEQVLKRLEESGKVLRDSGEWVQMPDSQRYGTMRGLYVRKDIADELNVSLKLDKQAKGYTEFFEKVNRNFKVAKVLLNPPTQFRNAASNLTLLNVSGIPWERIAPLGARATKSYKSDNNFSKAMRRMGLTSGTMTNAELARVEKIFVGSRVDGPFSAAKHLATTAVDKAGNLYQGVETVGKMTKVMDELEVAGHKGLLEDLTSNRRALDQLTAQERTVLEDAIMEAQDALFDYNSVHKTIDMLRRMPVGAPFITFQYKALPRLADAAVKRPWVYAKYAAVPAALAQASLSDDMTMEDFENMKKKLPDHIAKHGVWSIPFKDAAGRWQFFDASYFLPWGNMTQGMEPFLSDSPTTFTEKRKAIMDATGLLGGPIPSLVTAAKTGVDPFTGKEIVSASADAKPKDAAMAYLGYLWNLGTPSFLNTHGFYGHFKDKYIYQEGDRYGVPLAAQNVWGRAFGVNIYPVDVEEARRMSPLQLKGEHNRLVKELIRVRTNKGMDPDRKVEEIKKIEDAVDWYTRRYRSKTGQNLTRPKFKGTGDDR